jgi:hypothetical protein
VGFFLGESDLKPHRSNIFCIRLKPQHQGVYSLARSADTGTASRGSHFSRGIDIQPWSFVDSGGPGSEQVVTIAGDRRSLIITQNFGKSAEGRCDTVQTLTVPVFNSNREGIGAWSRQGYTSFFLDCINRVALFQPTL